MENTKKEKKHVVLGRNNKNKIHLTIRWQKWLKLFGLNDVISSLYLKVYQWTSPPPEELTFKTYGDKAQMSSAMITTYWPLTRGGQGGTVTYQQPDKLQYYNHSEATANKTVQIKKKNTQACFRHTPLQIAGAAHDHRRLKPQEQHSFGLFNHKKAMKKKCL